MDSARSWFNKLQPRDRLRGSSKRRENSAGGNEESTEPVDEEELSNITKQKVAAAKQYIENHYKEQRRNLQERRERYTYDCLPCFFIWKLIQYNCEVRMCSQSVCLYESCEAMIMHSITKMFN